MIVQHDVDWCDCFRITSRENDSLLGKGWNND